MPCHPLIFLDSMGSRMIQEDPFASGRAFIGQAVFIGYCDRGGFPALLSFFFTNRAEMGFRCWLA